MRIKVIFSIVASLIITIPLAAQVIEPPYDSAYTFTDLGSVPGVPTRYGGLTFFSGDSNVLLIGGNANTDLGLLYSIRVVRNDSNHIIGFVDSAAFFCDAAYNDGGVVYGPGGVLFLSRWPANELGQTKPGSSITDKIINLDSLGEAYSNSAVNFVPNGFPGAGQMKLVSWSGGQWYTAAYSPDDSGTYNIDSVHYETTIPGGPEGFIYVPPGSPLFADYNSMLVSEYSAGNVVTYQLDVNGDPDTLTRALFITGLTGAEGATIDRLTGDFLFSTFGGGDHVIVVKGFARPGVAQQDNPDRILFELKQNNPNPFKQSTAIQFSVPRSSYVNLKVTNGMGQDVTTLVDRELSAGRYTTQWNAAGLASGVYFYQLQAGNFFAVKKLLLLK
jgi:Secretion system C-terminal sorting domain